MPYGRPYILPEDLEHFLSEKKAKQAFDMLDINSDGRVGLHDIRDAVIKIYRDRKNLAATLKDTKSVVGRLEKIVGFVVHLFFVLFYLMIFNVRPVRSWTAMWSNVPFDVRGWCRKLVVVSPELQPVCCINQARHMLCHTLHHHV